MPRPVPPPGYVLERPRLRAVRDLDKELGVQNAFVDLVELALRAFEENINASTDPQNFVEAMREKYGTTSSLGTTWKAVRRNASLYAITQAYNVADAFFRELGFEYRKYKKITDQWVSQDGQRHQLDALTALTENLSQSNRDLAQTAPEYQLTQYFRGVRNATVHPNYPNSPRDDRSNGATNESTAPKDQRSALNSLEEERQKLISVHGEHLQKCYGMLPSTYRETGHTDFLLFTRCINYYSKLLNNACDVSALDIVHEHLRDAGFLAEVRRRKSTSARLGPLVSRLKHEFALTETETTNVRSVLEAFSRDDPNKKERKKMALPNKPKRKG